MLKSILCLFVLAFASMVGHCDEFAHLNNIVLTKQGIFVNIDGLLTPAHSICHMENGVYYASCDGETYYGHCRRCGWPRDKDGKCSNKKNCPDGGPNRD